MSLLNVPSGLKNSILNSTLTLIGAGVLLASGAVAAPVLQQAQGGSVQVSGQQTTITQSAASAEFAWGLV